MFVNRSFSCIRLWVQTSCKLLCKEYNSSIIDFGIFARSVVWRNVQVRNKKLSLRDAAFWCLDFTMIQKSPWPLVDFSKCCRSASLYFCALVCDNVRQVIYILHSRKPLPNSQRPVRCNSTFLSCFQHTRISWTLTNGSRAGNVLRQYLPTPTIFQGFRIFERSEPLPLLYLWPPATTNVEWHLRIQ